MKINVSFTAHLSTDNSPPEYADVDYVAEIVRNNIESILDDVQVISIDFHNVDVEVDT
jgi:hypothetical protein